MADLRISFITGFRLGQLQCLACPIAIRAGRA
jgi:hypothetical protein